MNLLSLRNDRLKLKTAGKLPIILEESIEYTSILIKENQRMSTCNRLDLQTLGSQQVMPKNLPDHWYKSAWQSNMPTTRPNYYEYPNPCTTQYTTCLYTFPQKCYLPRRTKCKCKDPKGRPKPYGSSFLISFPSCTVKSSLSLSLCLHRKLLRCYGTQGSLKLQSSGTET